MELFVNFFELIFINDQLPDTYYFPTMLASNLLTPQNASTSTSPAESRHRFVGANLFCSPFIHSKKAFNHAIFAWHCSAKKLFYNYSCCFIFFSEGEARQFPMAKKIIQSA